MRISTVFALVSHGLKSFAGFVQFSICGRFFKVSAGFLGFLQLCFGRFESWRKVITVIMQRYIFVGTISGARKRRNFATVLKEAFTVFLGQHMEKSEKRAEGRAERRQESQGKNKKNGEI